MRTKGDILEVSGSLIASSAWNVCAQSVVVLLHSTRHVLWVGVCLWEGRICVCERVRGGHREVYCTVLHSRLMTNFRTPWKNMERRSDRLRERFSCRKQFSHQTTRLIHTFLNCCSSSPTSPFKRTHGVFLNLTLHWPLCSFQNEMFVVVMSTVGVRLKDVLILKCTVDILFNVLQILPSSAYGMLRIPKMYVVHDDF